MKLKNTIALLITFLLFGSFTLIHAQDEKSKTKRFIQAKITMEQARETASKRVTGKIEGEELEREAGKLIYSFDIRNEKGTISEVWVDAQSGEVIKVQEENAAQEASEKRQDKTKSSRHKDDDDDEESEASKKANFEKYSRQAKITMEQAIEIALKRIPGTITDRDLEKERGKLMYSFDIRDANGKVFDVEIDAKTGKVLKAVEDTEDDDDGN